MKIKDLKKLIESFDDESEVITEIDNEFYDCFAEEKWLIVGESLPYLVITKEEV